MTPASGVVFDDDCADVPPAEDEGLQGELQGQVIDGYSDGDTIKVPDGTKSDRRLDNEEGLDDLWS